MIFPPSVQYSVEFLESSTGVGEGLGSHLQIENVKGGTVILCF